MFEELHILHPNRIYPEKSGGYLRTFNIAKLLSKKFSKTCIFAVDENVTYNNKIDEIYLIQEKKYSNIIDKMAYYWRGLFSRNFSLKSPERAFYNKNNALFQIEDPLFYNLLKKKNIKKYVLDEHNVNWELLTFPTFNFKYKIYNRLTFARNKSIEIKAIRDATHILVCSKRDKQAILQEVPEVANKVTIIPNCVDFSEYESYLRNMNMTYREKESLYVLFVGSLTHPPNIDALHIICNKIAPSFGSEVKFIIVGRNPPNITRQKNVKFLGYVEDVKRYLLESDICIAPLRYGSGTRLKILEYMAMGKPVISTTKGAEGIDYTPNKDIIIEDNVEAFTERIKELSVDKRKRDDIGKNAMKLIKEKYDWKIYRKTLHSVYDAIG